MASEMMDVNRNNFDCDVKVGGSGIAENDGLENDRAQTCR